MAAEARSGEIEKAASNDDLAIVNQLCFALYMSSQLVTGLYRVNLEPYGVTFPQYLILLALWEQSPISMSELGLKLYAESSALSPIIKRMQAAGLLSRQRDPEDERRVVLALTDKGIDVKDDITRARCKVINDIPLDDQQINALREQLAAMNATLLQTRDTYRATPELQPLSH